eukprot:m.26180 g.26180  ORF g.26180 m.26180 type:complete len:276 (-) comp13277_c0_seq1:64-891(-)
MSSRSRSIAVGVIAVLALCSVSSEAFPFSGGSMFMPPPWHRRPMHDIHRSPLDRLQEMMEYRRPHRQTLHPWRNMQPSQKHSPMGSNNLEEDTPEHTKPEVQQSQNVAQPVATMTTQEDDMFPTEINGDKVQEPCNSPMTAQNRQVPAIDERFRTGEMESTHVVKENNEGVSASATLHDGEIGGEVRQRETQEDDDDAIAAAIAREVLEESTHVPGYREEWASPETSGKGRVDLVRARAHRKLQPFSAHVPTPAHEESTKDAKGHQQSSSKAPEQ